MNRQKWEEQRRAEEMKAQNLKTMIKHQQTEAQNKRQMDLIDKQNRTRSIIENKLQREALEQNMYEQEIQRMEKEELDLIMRLKNIKLLEEQAHVQLEQAKKDPIEVATQS